MIFPTSKLKYEYCLFCALRALAEKTARVGSAPAHARRRSGVCLVCRAQRFLGGCSLWKRKKAIPLFAGLLFFMSVHSAADRVKIAVLAFLVNEQQDGEVIPCLLEA